MNVGLMTIFRSNYGAILQSYALQAIIESFGHSVEIIDYRSKYKEGYSFFLPWSNKNNIIINIFRMLRYKQMIERSKRLQLFHATHHHISKKHYRSIAELTPCANNYDVLVSGSDQVWNPGSDHERNQAFYLGFTAQTKVKKIAYAPSFGVSSIPQSAQQEIRDWINDFSHISVREETGRAIIEQVTGKQVPVVLDPTLLLETSQWANLSVPPLVNGPYVLVYSTSQRGLFPELVKHVKEVTSLPVVVLALSSFNMIQKADRVIFDAGPSEFLSLFANATCVCTNSFHGLAFSLVFRKPFWSVPHPHANSRIADLLCRIDLSSRQVHSQSEFPETPLELDYTKASLLLLREKENSINFLCQALQDVAA